MTQINAGKSLEYGGAQYALQPLRLLEMQSLIEAGRRALDPVTMLAKQADLSLFSDDDRLAMLKAARQQSDELTVAIALRQRQKRNASLPKDRQKPCSVLSDEQYDLLERYDEDSEVWIESIEGLAVILHLATRKKLSIEDCKEAVGELGEGHMQSVFDQMQFGGDPANPTQGETTPHHS